MNYSDRQMDFELTAYTATSIISTKHLGLYYYNGFTFISAWIKNQIAGMMLCIYTIDLDP